MVAPLGGRPVVDPVVCRLCGSARVPQETAPAGGDALAKIVAQSFQEMRGELVLIRQALAPARPSPLPISLPGSQLRMVPYPIFDRVPFGSNTAETWPPGVYKWVTMDDADEWYVHARNTTNQTASLRVKSADSPSNEGANNILRAPYELAAGAVVAILGQGQWYPYLTATVQFATAPTSGHIYLALVKRLR